MTTSTARRALSAVAALASLSLVAACGSDNKTTSNSSGVTCATGTISGAGSSFVNTLMQQWIKDFQAACSGATINYQSVGSGAGVQQFTAGTVDFAGSDGQLKDDEMAAAKAKGGDVLQVPWTAGGVAVMVHINGVTSLKLSPEAIAGIFAGKITKWNDPAITADNAGVTLPNEAIQVVHRSDGSGTTKVFTSYLTAVAPSVWKAGADKTVAWPTGQGAKGSDGVTTAVAAAEGGIGYAEVSYAKAANLTMAQVKNPSGAFVAPTQEAVAAAISSADVNDATLKVSVDYTPSDAAAYPISTVTYGIFFTQGKDAAKATLLKDFVTYVLDKGQAAAGGLDYAALPDSLLTKDKAAVAALAG